MQIIYVFRYVQHHQFSDLERGADRYQTEDRTCRLYRRQSVDIVFVNNLFA